MPTGEGRLVRPDPTERVHVLFDDSDRAWAHRLSALRGVRIERYQDGSMMAVLPDGRCFRTEDGAETWQRLRATGG